MHCDEVQEELARDSITPGLAAAVHKHLDECAACRRVQLLYSRIDKTLKQNSVWEPPEEFVETVVRRAAPALQGIPEPPRIVTWDVVYGTVLALLLIAVMYFGIRVAAASMAANAVVVAWVSAALSLFVSFWVTRRALR